MFSIGAAMAGPAGVPHGVAITCIDPIDAGPWNGVHAATRVVVGGVSAFAGPLVGTPFPVAPTELRSRASPRERSGGRSAAIGPGLEHRPAGRVALRCRSRRRPRSEPRSEPRSDPDPILIRRRDRGSSDRAADRAADPDRGERVPGGRAPGMRADA